MDHLKERWRWPALLVIVSLALVFLMWEKKTAVVAVQFVQPIEIRNKNGAFKFPDVESGVNAAGNIEMIMQDEVLTIVIGDLTYHVPRSNLACWR